MIHFTVEGPPVGKERPRQGKDRRFYTPQKTRDYEARIALAFRQACPFPIPLRATCIQVRCFFSSQRRPDLDNILKVVLDGLAGLAYANDRQITQGKIAVGTDVEHPRLEVEVG